jgi:tRNA threonylcarbamoyl adenosine modification protein (Sua5/YciO/YrdC/YwlC family)
MRLLIYEGVFATIMATLTTSYLKAFALALGADNIMIGLLTSVPAILWTLNQIPSAVIVEYTGEKKLINALSSFLSRILWIPILLIPSLWISRKLTLLLGLVTLSTYIGSFAGPAWASLVSEIVPRNIRGRYFSKRGKISAAFGLIASLVAGWYLDLFPKNDLTGFSIVFFVGVVCGVISSYIFSKIPKPEISKEKGDMLPKLQASLKNKSFKIFLITSFIWQFSYMFASPFFVVYLLEDLGAGYIWISILAVFSGISGILIRNRVGRVSDKYGHRTLLILSGFGAGLLPFMWVVAPSAWFLIPLYVWSGIVWTGFRLAQFNYLLELSETGSKAFLSALFWTVVGLANITAPFLGGYLAEQPVVVFGMTGLVLVFVVSGFLRMFSSLMFMRYLEEPVYRPRFLHRYVLEEIFRPDFSQFGSGFNYMPLRLAETTKLITQKVRMVERRLDERREKMKRSIIEGYDEVFVFYDVVSVKSKDAVKKCMEVLEQGGTVIYPSETCYGVMADATNEKAVRKVYRIKERDKNKPLLMLVSDLEMAKKYAVLNPVAERLIERFMPGPLTIITDKTKNVLDVVNKKEVSFRIPGDRFSQELVKKFGRPVVSTSANKSGRPPIYEIEKIKRLFSEEVDLIVDGGNLPRRPPTTVFDTRSLKILRHGKITARQIKKAIKDLFE